MSVITRNLYASKRLKDNRNQHREHQARADRSSSRKQTVNTDRRQNTSKDRSLDFSGLIRSSISSAGSLDRSINQKINTSQNRSHDQVRAQEKVSRTDSSAVQSRSHSYGQIFDRQKKNRDHSLNRSRESIRDRQHDHRRNRSLSLSRDLTNTLSPVSKSFGGKLRRVFKLILGARNLRINWFSVKTFHQYLRT